MIPCQYMCLMIYQLKHTSSFHNTHGHQGEQSDCVDCNSHTSPFQVINCCDGDIIILSCTHTATNHCPHAMHHLAGIEHAQGNTQTHTNSHKPKQTHIKTQRKRNTHRNMHTDISIRHSLQLFETVEVRGCRLLVPTAHTHATCHATLAIETAHKHTHDLS